ncbi:hypothetical protein [Confluentibacter sediminis]|uniref:hypothetical protein n=1 Tax=Confluentibacter sediminis TaxID=2219045 RepID=UPI000DAC2FFE|nr:hypothetical protein [Confluentibacter sediminis]
MLNKKKINYVNLKLEFLESAILKTYALGYSEKDICNLLDLKISDYHLILHKLYLKYNTRELFQTVYLAIENGQIDRYDLVKEETKQAALLISKKVVDYFNTDNVKASIITELIKTFIEETHKNFLKNLDATVNLDITQEQSIYCYLKITNNLNAKSRISYQIINSNNNIEKNLAYKLKVNNFFNVIRRIFELNLINRTKFISDHNGFEKKLLKTYKDKIACVKYIKKAKLEEQNLYIYFDLINFYNDLENKSLHIKKYKKNHKL